MVQTATSSTGATSLRKFDIMFAGSPEGPAPRLVADRLSKGEQNQEGDRTEVCVSLGSVCKVGEWGGDDRDKTRKNAGDINEAAKHLLHSNPSVQQVGGSALKQGRNIREAESL